MENYIDLLRNIVKNFKYSNEFDDIIKRILNKYLTIIMLIEKNIFIVLIIHIRNTISQNITL